MRLFYFDVIVLEADIEADFDVDVDIDFDVS